jgi:hypothetical protein
MNELCLDFSRRKEIVRCSLVVYHFQALPNVGDSGRRVRKHTADCSHVSRTTAIEIYDNRIWSDFYERWGIHIKEYRKENNAVPVQWDSIGHHEDNMFGCRTPSSLYSPVRAYICAGFEAAARNHKILLCMIFLFKPFFLPSSSSDSSHVETVAEKIQKPNRVFNGA